jgi:hypothetical protein
MSGMVYNVAARRILKGEVQLCEVRTVAEVLLELVGVKLSLQFHLSSTHS